jgi:transcription elongation factor Elf1
MIIWKKKLIQCCRCHKKYSFDDNLFYHLKEYILICSNCNLMHKVDIKLLGKEYEGLKKIDKLNLTAIDIGSPATNQTYTKSVDTHIDGNNAANDSGKITEVKIYAATQMAGCVVAIFEPIDATHFTTRDYETVNNGNGAGVVLVGQQTFTVDLDVVAGDFIGLYFSAGAIDLAVGGGAYIYRAAGSKIPCTNQLFAAESNRILSIGGTGATEEEAATDNAIMMGMEF